MDAKKKIISLLFLGLLIIFVPLLVIIIRQRVNLAPRAANGTADEYFLSNSYILNPNATVSMLVNPVGNLIGFAEVQITFDKSKVQLTANPVFPGSNPLTTTIAVDSMATANNSGVINMTLALPPNATAPSSAFEFVQLSFSAVGGATGTTDLNITGGKQLWETGGTAVPYTAHSTTLTLNPVSSTAVPTDTTAPTSIPGATATTAPTSVPSNNPNSCGGTCGSNSNCNSGLVCSAGFCRNPSCTSSTDCNCPSATATPRPTTVPSSSSGSTNPTAVPTNYVYPTTAYGTPAQYPTQSDNPFLGGGPRDGEVTVPDINYEPTPDKPVSFWVRLIQYVIAWFHKVFGFR